jgi:hypothetical protein
MKIGSINFATKRLKIKRWTSKLYFGVVPLYVPGSRKIMSFSLAILIATSRDGTVNCPFENC